MGPDLLLCIFKSLRLERKELQRARWPLTNVHGLGRLAGQSSDCGLCDISSLWAKHSGPSSRWLHQTRSQCKKMLYEGDAASLQSFPSFPWAPHSRPLSASIHRNLSLLLGHLSPRNVQIGSCILFGFLPKCLLLS